MSPQQRDSVGNHDDSVQREGFVVSFFSKRDEAYSKPSDEYVLNFAFFSFVGFVMFQTVFALMANSQAMLADSEAMAIDALTYAFNACAERFKTRPISEPESRLAPQVLSHKRELRRLYLELIPPLISVSALVTITILTLDEASTSLFHPDEADDNDEVVSITIMLIFSAANLLLDLVNVTCFARADSAFGLNIMSHENEIIRDQLHSPQIQRGEETAGLLQSSSTATRHSYGSDGLLRSTDVNNEGSPVNLNMCSAWTHVCADTLRSLTVLIVAFIATIFPSIDGGKADSVAAIIVSFVILGSLVPLLQGLTITAMRIVSLHRKPVGDKDVDDENR